MKMNFFTKGFKSKLKNAILKTVTFLMVFVVIFGLSTIDSVGKGFLISLFCIFLPFLWLVPFGIVNGIIRL